MNRFTRSVTTCRWAVAFLLLALIGGTSAAADAARPQFPADTRLDALLITKPHDLGGGPAAECYLMESLTGLRLSVLPVPHESGDHIADMDGMFGKHPMWVPIRRQAILEALAQPRAAVIVAAPIDDAAIDEALGAHVAAGGTLVWMAGDRLPASFQSVTANPDAPAADPLAGLNLAAAGMRLARGGQVPEGLAVVHALPGAAGKPPTPLVAVGTLGKGRVLAIASKGSLFPVACNRGVDGDLVWAGAFERLVRHARGERLPPAAPVDVPAPLPLKLDLFTTRQGNAPDFATQSQLAIAPEASLGKATLHWRVRDWARRTVHTATEPLDIAAGTAIARTFDHTLADPDPRAYVSWLEAAVTDAAGTVIGRATTKLYRYRPYRMNEQLLLGTWHCEEGSERPGLVDAFADHLRDTGFNAVLGFQDDEVLERHNFRKYIEHGGTTGVGVSAAAPFSAPIEGYAERYAREGLIRAGVKEGFGQPGYRGPWPTAALNMYSMGEETGYGRWSQAYPWRSEPEAPEDCNKWFRLYLRQLYGDDLARLNAAWGRDFKDWQEIKVWRKYAEPFGWMFMPPPKEVEPNLTPFVDTHAFHEWYVGEYFTHYMRGYAEADPATTWTMSYDFTFLQFPPAPMTNFWGALAPEGVALWHNYVRSRTPGAPNPFHLDWMFFEDDRMNNQFLQLGLASGCTYLCSWGHAFNGDLTPSRTALAVTRTRKLVERPEAVLREMTPRTDPRVGIYTFDSRWALVRGRYGFYLERGGPYDVALGKGPHQSPGASYLCPPELPLHAALCASGYAPRYVRPEEFAGCDVLFVPYVEALDEATAAKLRGYVEGGGTLIAFPTLAQFDEGGKPYPTCPGAGLDALLGFTADPAWVMGRQTVQVPGRNAAQEAFAEYWMIGEDKQPTDRTAGLEPPLYFTMPIRIGGHPNHLMPDGHQRLTNLAKDVVVVGHHEDGQPLFTYRKAGKGEAICFNMLLCGETTLTFNVDDTTETFRLVIDQLVRRRGVAPDFEFRNLRAYDEGISDFVTMQYDLPGTPTRILSLFGDHRGRRAEARLRLRKPFTAAYDVLTGRPLSTIASPTGDATEAVVNVEPGHWRLLALTEAPVPEPTITGPASAPLGAVVPFAVNAGTNLASYGRVEVLGPDGTILPHHSGSVALGPGKPFELRLRLDDPLPGGERPHPWRVRFIDAITGGLAETTLAPQASPASVAAAAVEIPATPELRSWQLARRGPEIDDAEFLGLLHALRDRHLDPKPVDKRRYGYYAYEMGDSRHRIDQLLACVDWTTRAEALAAHVATGQRLYLVGEDLGIDPVSGVSTTPGRRPRIVEALQHLVDSGRARLLAVVGQPDLRLVTIGTGSILLDRRSPDATGNTNLHLAAFHRDWLAEIGRLGLAPGGTGTATADAGGQPIGRWLEGEHR